MMNFIFTFVTLACGMLVGVIATFTFQSKSSKVLKFFTLVGTLFLLLLTMLVGSLCEEQINASHMLPFIPWVTTTAIVVYGMFLGVIISLSSEMKMAFKEKNENLTLAGAAGFTALPSVLWVILSIGTPYNCWNCLAGAIFLGFTVTAVLWLIFSVSCWMIKPNKKNLCA